MAFKATAEHPDFAQQNPLNSLQNCGDLKKRRQGAEEKGKRDE